MGDVDTPNKPSPPDSGLSFREFRRVTVRLRARAQKRRQGGCLNPVAVLRVLSEDWSPWVACLRRCGNGMNSIIPLRANYRERLAEPGLSRIDSV